MNWFVILGWKEKKITPTITYCYVYYIWKVALFIVIRLVAMAIVGAVFEESFHTKFCHIAKPSVFKFLLRRERSNDDNQRTKNTDATARFRMSFRDIFSKK